MGLFSELLPFLPASRQHRLRFILEYRFPPEALVSLRQEHPDWSEAKIGDAFRSLRQFLCLPLLSSGKARRPRSRIEMPSFVADEAWHAFLRSPRAYSKFCRTAYGFELSHIPDPSASPRILRAGDRIKPSVAETWRRSEAGSRELPARSRPDRIRSAALLRRRLLEGRLDLDRWRARGFALPRRAPRGFLRGLRLQRLRRLLRILFLFLRRMLLGECLRRQLLQRRRQLLRRRMRRLSRSPRLRAFLAKRFSRG